ncbi:unnamed protein product, partial [Allacma fusca]
SQLALRGWACSVDPVVPCFKILEDRFS